MSRFVQLLNLKVTYPVPNLVCWPNCDRHSYYKVTKGNGWVRYLLKVKRKLHGFFYCT